MKELEQTNSHFCVVCGSFHCSYESFHMADQSLKFNSELKVEIVLQIHCLKPIFYYVFHYYLFLIFDFC